MLSRVGISLDEELLEKFDVVVQNKGYSNRSEAIRDLIRDALVKKEWETADDTAVRVAAAIVVYDHDAHDLGHRLTHMQHDSHEMIISTTHVHMDEQNCLEVLLLKGPGCDISRFGNALISMSGVKMGKLVLATRGDQF